MFPCWRLAALAPAFAPLLLAPPTVAADAPAFNLTIKDHRFAPAEITVPAQERVQLIVENHDATPEEFESIDLRREKLVTGNSKISVWIGPLPVGAYRFFGDFHQANAQGKLIAK